MRKARQYVILAVIVAAGAAVAAGLSGEPGDEETNAAAPATAPVTGKGPGMGRQYKENVPDAGKGSPEHRGGRDHEIEEQEEPGDDTGS